jgi:hypothetical protein
VRRLRALALLGLVLAINCAPVRPSQAPLLASSAASLPDTSAQKALARQYLELVTAERYTDAWQLLTPERQRRQSPDVFAADWQAWGRLLPDPSGNLFVWPAADDEVRADVAIQYSATSWSRDHLSIDLERLANCWRIADEHGRGHHERGVPTTAGAPTDLARNYVLGIYGSLWLATLDVLDQEPFEDGQVLIFRFVDPLLEPRTAGPRPIAVLLFAEMRDGGWGMSGGGAIGTVAEVDRYAVSCAWTWLRDNEGPTVAAFYCTVEDPRVAAIELERVDGRVQRLDVTGKRAAMFPYAWDMQTKWPAQQPRAIRLFDIAGNALPLSTSSVIGQAP